MNWLHERAMRGDILAGCWETFGSSVIAEMAAWCGFDWILIDHEHGYAGDDAMLGELHAVEGTGAAGIVRVESHDPALYKQALDNGASGIMSPMVNTPEQARAIVQAMRYPPEGNRGITGAGRGARYGLDIDEYMTRANRELLNIVQIETPEAVDNIDAIAAIDGVHVLFVGPGDLSLNMGIRGQFDDPGFKARLRKVAASAKAHGKAAGILFLRDQDMTEWVDMGYTFVASGVDSVILRNGFLDHRRKIETLKRK